MTTHRTLPRRHGRGRLRPAARRNADHPGDAGRRDAARRTSPRRSTSAASMSPASSFRWCRRARPASAPRCRRRSSDTDIDLAIGAFDEAGRELGSSEHARPRSKPRPSPASGWRTARSPRSGPRTCWSRCTRPASAAPTSTSTNGTSGRHKTVPVPMITGHEYSGEIAALGDEVRNPQIGQRVSGEGHVVGMKSRASRARKVPSRPRHQGHRRQPARRLRRVCEDPGLQHHAAARCDRRRDGRHPRSARQCRAHRARLRHRRRGCAGDRRRPHRHHGRRRRPPCRRAPCGDHRREPRAAAARDRGAPTSCRSTSRSRTCAR